MIQPSMHMPSGTARQPLGELLVQRGVLTAQQLQERFDAMTPEQQQELMASIAEEETSQAPE